VSVTRSDAHLSSLSILEMSLLHSRRGTPPQTPKLQSMSLHSNGMPALEIFKDGADSSECHSRPPLRPNKLTNRLLPY
jgi:hypothetical protein